MRWACTQNFKRFFLFVTYAVDTQRGALEVLQIINNYSRIGRVILTAYKLFEILKA